MKNIICILFFGLFSLQQLYSQVPDTIWTKSYDFILANRFIETKDLGFLFMGRNYNSDNLLLIKMDNMGDTLWTKKYDRFKCPYFNGHILQTTDSSFILAASTQPFITGKSDIGILKTNKDGDTLLTRIIGTDSTDLVHDFQPTLDSGYVILTKSNYFDPTRPVLWLIKTDKNLDTLWSKTLPSVIIWDDIFKYTIIQTSDSGFVITGSTSGNNGAVLILKLDFLGNIEWQKGFDLDLGGDDWGVAVIEENNGYLVLDFGNSVSLIKTDLNGDSLWTKKILSQVDRGTSMHSSFDGTYIITGYTNEFHGDTGWILNVDNYGNLLWKKELVYNYFGASIGSSINTSDSCYIALGHSYFTNILYKLCPTPNSINNHQNKIETFRLFQNFPNPFNPTTKIKYELPKSEKVKIEIFNLLGQKIETLLNKQMPTGIHKIEFNGQKLPSGVYLYRIEAGKFQYIRKMILLR